MKAEELSIGNYVYSSFSDGPCKITGIEISEFGYPMVKLDNVVGDKDIASLSPTSIDLNIMNNNFIIDENYFYEYFKNKDIIVYNIDFIKDNSDGTSVVNKWHLFFNTQTCEVMIEDDPCMIVKYVHQLQNILRNSKCINEIKL